MLLGAGTGGTLAGCARYLKPRIRKLKVILADPLGSGLYNRIRHGVFYTAHEQEGRRRRSQVDTVVEGVGLKRMTANLDLVLGRGVWERDTDKAMRMIERDEYPSMTSTPIRWIDDAYKISDRQAAYMARYLALTEGLFVGSSSALNLCACYRLCKDLPVADKPVKIVTILCDSGQRHLSKFWNDDFLTQAGVIRVGEFELSDSLRQSMESLSFMNDY